MRENLEIKEKGAGGDDDKEYDGLTEVIGSVGLFHLTTFFLLNLSVTTHSFQMLANKWLTNPTDYWCARPPALQDLDQDAWLNLSAPLDRNGDLDRCSVFDVDFAGVSGAGGAGGVSLVLERPPEDTPTRPCQEFEYDMSEFQDTAIHRWDLVCTQKYVPRYIQTIFFVGNFAGVLASGPIADTFGRQFCYSLFVTIWITSGLVGSLTSNLYVWSFTRFMCGAMSLGYNNVLSVYGVELTTGKWRAYQGYFFGANAWDGGVILLAILVYFCRNMQTLEMVIALMNIPFLLAWFLMPESPRWLLSKGKNERARKIIRMITKANKRPLEKVDPFVDSFKLDKKQQQGNITDLFRTPAIRRNSILMCFCWLSFSMGYFGLFYNIPPLSWSPFLVFAVPAVFALLANPIEPILENTLGRKLMLTASLVSAGIMLFLTLAFPKDHYGIIICAWTGAFCCGIAFGAGYTYTKDLYPTTLRSTALGTASASARIGSILSPIIAISSSVHQVLPLVLYGATLFSAGIGSIWIWPETKRIHLIYTVEECEQLARTENTWVAALTCRRPKEERSEAPLEKTY